MTTPISIPNEEKSEEPVTIYIGVWGRSAKRGRGRSELRENELGWRMSFSGGRSSFPEIVKKKFHRVGRQASGEVEM